MTNKGDKKTASTKTSRRTVTSKAGTGVAAPEPVPFADALEYLDAWFAVLEPSREDVGGLAPLGRIPSFDERAGYLSFLLARTERSVAAGLDLPFESWVRRHELDLVDRLVLLALLRAALHPEGDGGLLLPRLLRDLGADSLGRQHRVLSRVETAGRLRDLGAVHCYPYPSRSQRTFRLAPWLAGPLTTGEGDLEGLPEISVDPNEELQVLRNEAVRVVEAVAMDTTTSILLWQAPAEGRPGWDHVALRRRRLASRLEASARSATSPVGAELRRLGLEGEERLAWAFLLHDAQQDPVGVMVPLLVRLAGRTSDPEAAAERLLGPGSKLAANDCVRFSRADGPFLARLAWLSREASARVVPWPRDAFAVQPGSNGEPVVATRRVFGFDARGVRREDRAAATGRAA